MPTPHKSPTLELCTNPGRGGISIIKLHAQEATLKKIDRMVSERNAPLGKGGLSYGWLRDGNGDKLDEVLLSCPQAEQRILTGHGGTANTLSLVKFLTDFGFAENSEAETGTQDYYLSKCHTQAQAALVISEFASGAPDISNIEHAIATKNILLTGAPNCGKSSLLNRICKQQRALVSDIAGTTLDQVSHNCEIGGHYCCISDNAGFRVMAQSLEKIALQKQSGADSTADVIIHVFDGSREITADDLSAAYPQAQAKTILVINKADLPQKIDPAQNGEIKNYFSGKSVLKISCQSGLGLDELFETLALELGGKLY